MATRESEVMLLSAAVEPRLMRERRHETMKETTMAFIGTSHPGGTYFFNVSYARLNVLMQDGEEVHMRAMRRTEHPDRERRRRAGEKLWQRWRGCRTWP